MAIFLSIIVITYICVTVYAVKQQMNKQTVVSGPTQNANTFMEMFQTLEKQVFLVDRNISKITLF